MRNNFVALVTTVIFIALASGCETVTNNNESANKNSANNNTVVLQTDNANMGTNSNKSNSNVSREDVERNKTSYREEAKKAGRKIGQGANDLWLWVKTRSALAYADDLRDSTIDVDVENDVVTLSGTVANASQKSQAEKIAKDIEGVKSVKNSLRIKADNSETNTNANKKNMNKK